MLGNSPRPRQPAPQAPSHPRPSPLLPPPHPTPPQAHALLHGHSYTAYPLGCAASLASLAILESPDLNPNLCCPGSGGGGSPLGSSQESSSGGSSGSGGGAAGGGCSSGGRSGAGARCRAAQAPGGSLCGAACGALLPMWDAERVAALSASPGVAGVVCIGTVLAAELRPRPAGGGRPPAARADANCDGGARTGADGGAAGGGAEGAAYFAGGAAGVVAGLRARGVFARPLGNTVYLMVTPTTDRAECGRLLGALEAAAADHWRGAA
jgi:dethiobiotin synthetase/adenosylmethionine--8-amino-7-oxononanoate aminotransferase